LIDPRDMVAQSRQDSQNSKAILNSVGDKMDDIVSVIIYVTEMEPLMVVHQLCGLDCKLGRYPSKSEF